MADDVRVMRLTVDVRSFKAGLRLPMKAINACVRVVFPPQIVKLAHKSALNAAKLTAPIRTHPPVMVQKGSEATLSNGYVALELPVSVSGLAAALNEDLRLEAQVFHREKYAADSLIGTASIPMSSLMKETWLDGYATVYSSSKNDGQVNIGSLRVVLSAEELGPVTTQAHKCIQQEANLNKREALSTPGLEDPFQLLKKTFTESLPSKVVAVQTEAQADSDSKSKTKPSKERSERIHGAHDKPLPTADADEKLRRYELEWEFERWKRAEEARWRTALKEKEVKRIAALEAEWKEMERERMVDIDKTRVELSNLEAKFKTKLFALEKRERALVIAEEEASMRREAWKRDCAQRAADAEVAVKRLQSECEHRVELERAKYAALKEQHSVLEKRLATANAALLDLEKRFSAYKSEHCKTSEAELVGQVMLLKQQCNDLRRNLDQSVRLKNEYRIQIQKLAKELAKLHRQHTQEEAERRVQNRGNHALQSFIEAQAKKHEEEKMELQQLKEQLQNFQIHERTLGEAAKASVPDATLKKQEESKSHSCCMPTKCHCADSAAANEKDASYGNSKGLNEAIQVDLNMEDAFRDDTEKQISSRQGRDDLANWLSAELSMDDEDMLDRKSIVSTLEDGKMDEAEATCIRASFLSDDVLHGQLFDLDDELKGFDTSFYGQQLSEFQNSEIKRLQKQRSELLQTGVYTEEDPIIKGLDEEVEKIQRVDTTKFAF